MGKSKRESTSEKSCRLFCISDFYSFVRGINEEKPSMRWEAEEQYHVKIQLDKQKSDYFNSTSMP